MEVRELAPGLWGWTAPHPDWEPSFSWPQDVWCWYVETEEATLLVDPLVPSGEEERFFRHLDADVERRGVRVAVLLTQAAHARDAARVARRYEAEVWGHEDARAKVDAPFRVVAPGDVCPGGAQVLAFDQEPEGSGTPLHLPSHRAVAVGDVFLTVDGELRTWWGTTHAGGRGWYDERTLPALRRWLDLDVEHVLVAHGELVEGGGAALAAALDRPPHEQE